jgi:hypothetical protein
LPESSEDEDEDIEQMGVNVNHWKCHTCSKSIEEDAEFVTLDVTLDVTAENDKGVAGVNCIECATKMGLALGKGERDAWRRTKRTKKHKFPKYLGKCGYCKQTNIYTGLNGKYEVYYNLIICNACRMKKTEEVTGYRIVSASDPQMINFQTKTLSV